MQIGCRGGVPGAMGGHHTWSVAQWLLHDRDPAHKSSGVQAAAPSLGLQNVQLPASAADVEPMYFGVFGELKGV
jgi:hypothetical protein